MATPRATHQQIADVVGVSRVAVSQVLHKSQRSRISVEKQREIEQVAREMGYLPRNLTTRNIGYVGRANALHLAGENRQLLLVDRALRAKGYKLILTTLEGDNPQSLGDIINPKTVDGVLFTRWFGGEIRGLLPPEVPWLVMADEDAVDSDVDKVVMDTVATTIKVVKHLQEFGHRRIGTISSVGIGGVTSHINEGVRQALCETNHNEEFHRLEILHDADIKNELLPMMKGPNAPTALIVFGTEKLAVVLSILYSAGFKIPEDVSLVSLLDSHLLEALTPSITATTAMGEEVAERAVNRLIEKINSPNLAPQHIMIPGEIVPRGSVTRPKCQH
jgi:DNA-binding LacI/PurR family transcriptional regulator